MAGDSHREVACVAAAFRPASSLCSGEFRARWVQVRTGTLAIFPSPQGHDIADFAFAYLGQTLNQPVRLARDEYANVLGGDVWRRRVAACLEPPPRDSQPVFQTGANRATRTFSSVALGHESKHFRFF